jgi:hypothetical protein
MKVSKDNKVGLILCNQLAVKDLRPRDREFVNSIMRQVIDRPTKFRLSEKQHGWLKDIKRRNP